MWTPGWTRWIARAHGPDIAITATIWLALQCLIAVAQAQFLKLGNALIVWMAAFFLVSPLTGFPVWLLGDLLRRSRRPGFPRRRACSAVGALTAGLPLLCLLIDRRYVFILFAILATTCMRLLCPRSPWPRLLRLYAPSWPVLFVLSFTAILSVASALELPKTPAKLAAFLVPPFLAVQALIRAHHRHKGQALRLPSRCVLFLRPFGVDDAHFAEVDKAYFLGIKRRRSVSFDEFVSYYVDKHLGSFISFGDPGDIALRPGARRYYVADGYWQAVFAQMIHRAPIVLAVVDTISEGLAWELAELCRLGLHTRLFLFTAPLHKNRKELRLLAAYQRAAQLIFPTQTAMTSSNSWKYTSARLCQIGFRLEVPPGPGAVVGFSADGAARILAQNCQHPAEFINTVATSLLRSGS